MLIELLIDMLSKHFDREQTHPAHGRLPLPADPADAGGYDLTTTVSQFASQLRMSFQELSKGKATV